MGKVHPATLPELARAVDLDLDQAVDQDVDPELQQLVDLDLDLELQLGAVEVSPPAAGSLQRAATSSSSPATGAPAETRASRSRTW